MIFPRSRPTRRRILTGFACAAASAAATSMGRTQGDAAARFADLERVSGGRLCVATFDSGNDAGIAHRADERVAMCSTFKFLAAAFVLARVDRGEESLARRIAYSRQDLVAYSPVTERHAGPDGMTLESLCDAAVTLSDNTAGNLLLASFGGPAGLTTFVRSLGDPITRLDRIEPALNEAAPGDPRDTTTAAAMIGLMRSLLLSEMLSRPSRKQLITWLVATRTGDRRLRAGVPATWRVGDKTGTSGNGLVADIAILWPPERPPLLAAAYLAESKVSVSEGDRIIAQVGRIIVESA